MSSKNRIFLSPPHLSGKEMLYIQEAFDENWIAPLGPNVTGFEESLELYLKKSSNKEDYKYAVALSSGTAAIHLGLLLLDVKPGDEVICQSFTFIATANPIRYLGANPVFVDSERDTWNMSPYFLEKAIQDRISKTRKKPKAIILVHLYGMPAKIDEITQIASKYEIPILEDAAEALGSEYVGKRCGTFGEFAVLSFNGNKIITTSGGGALVCSTREQAEKAKYYATQSRENKPFYQHIEVGYNYRMSNICAGIGRGQMSILDQHVLRCRKINKIYDQYLSNIPGIKVYSNTNEKFNSNYWLTCILIDYKLSDLTPEKIRLTMEKENIETRLLWKPMHLQPVFSEYPFYGDGTSESFFKKGLCLPSGYTLSQPDIERIAYIIKTI